MENFEINFLDHVAVRVKDLKRAAEWYQRVLGLEKKQFEEWGDFPIFMMSGKTGVALFPANENDPILDKESKNIKIDHFAFNVSNENFEKAKRKLERLEIEYEQQNHYFFDSIYLKDPDGHIVELTTIVVPDKSFYFGGKRNR